MGKKLLTKEQKRLDLDLWIIAGITLGSFLLYAVRGNQWMDYISNPEIPVWIRLSVNALLQFGVAGLGITIVCIVRKEKFQTFGLQKKHTVRTIAGTVLSFLPYICSVFVSGQFEEYRPFDILITREVIASEFPISILGLLIIILVWGFFEGFNYAVIYDKINKRYPSNRKWVDYGAITCAAVCLLFHPIRISFWGITEMVTTFAAIYGMLLVKKSTGNAWGCIFAFCFIWNAL